MSCVGTTFLSSRGGNGCEKDGIKLKVQVGRVEDIRHKQDVFVNTKAPPPPIALIFDLDR